MTSKRGGRGTSTGETVEVHDSEGDGEVNVIDDGLTGSITSIGEANAANTETHLAEVDGGQDSEDDGHVCPYCGESFDSGQALGGHKPRCPEKEDVDGNADAYDGMSEFERQGFEQAAEETPHVKNENKGAVVLELSHDEAYRVVRCASESVARRVFDAAAQGVSE